MFCRGLYQEPHILPCLSPGWVLYGFQLESEKPKWGSSIRPPSVESLDLLSVWLKDGGQKVVIWDLNVFSDVIGAKATFMVET